MKLKVYEVGKGLYPQEVMVGIRSLVGEKRMLIDKRAIEGEKFVKVGSPISMREGNYLVELPRETTAGEWRVWVALDQVAMG